MTEPSRPADAAVAAVAAIVAFNHGRDPALVQRKYAAMRRGPFAFLRGTCHVFATGWPAVDILDRAPRVWLAGDLHAGNFGAYRGDNRLTYFDVHDFGEAALGPLTWDVGRLLASLLVGAREWDLDASDALALAARALVAYRTELLSGKPAWIERESARGLARRLFAQVSGRSRTDLLDRYTGRRGRRRRFTADGRRILQLGDEERAPLEAMLAAIGERAGDPGYYRPVDVAQRVAGIGSIGLPRYLALVEGRGPPDRNVILDIESSHPSVIAWRLGGDQPGWDDEAARVVAVQRQAVAVPPAFLQAAEARGDHYVIRELQPAADSVRLADWMQQPRKLAEAVVTIASVAAWMHLRGAAWRGSDTPEQLGEFARDDQWQPVLLDAARDNAARVLDDFGAFARAAETGALNG